MGIDYEKARDKCMCQEPKGLRLDTKTDLWILSLVSRTVFWPVERDDRSPHNAIFYSLLEHFATRRYSVEAVHDQVQRRFDLQTGRNGLLYNGR